SRNGDDEDVKEDAKALHPNHVPESGSGIPRHPERRPKRGQSADQCDRAERLVAVLFVEQRVNDHDQHAKDREHQLRQNAHVVGTLRQGSLRLCQQARQGVRERRRHYGCPNHCHWPTSLLANCVTGPRAYRCTAGSIALSHTRGTTPITSAATAIGQSAAFSRRLRSGNLLLISCVTLPKKTR